MEGFSEKIHQAEVSYVISLLLVTIDRKLEDIPVFLDIIFKLNLLLI